MSNWISVKDKLPKENQEVLWMINCDEDEPVICQGFIDQSIEDDNLYFITLPKILARFEDANLILHGRMFEPYEPLSMVTHWMPLPEVPK